MKTIKIFLASSEELKEERKELADIIANLNHILSRRDIFVDLVKWEYLDASMGASHKQEEYNAELRECELCMVIYWKRFGKYTKTELETAYSELKEGHNPKKLYVYFKDSENLSEEMRTFKASFPSEYGHFSTDFGNTDTLKAHFLLQFMEYLSNDLHVKDFLEIKDSKVIVNGQSFVNLGNVPFAGNNEEYNLLQKNIKKTKKLLSISEPDDPEYSEYAQELQELEEKLAQMENSLWETALMVTKLSSTKQSERLQRAMDLFNSGDNKGAMAVLNEEDIDRDVQHNLRLIELGEEGKKGLKTNIEEYIFRIKTLWNMVHNSTDESISTSNGWDKEVLYLHKKILDLSSKLFGEESLEIAQYQEDAASDFSLLDEHQGALKLYEKALCIRLMFGKNLDVAQLYDEISNEYYELGNPQKSLDYAEKGLQIRLQIQGENHPDAASSYSNLSKVYSCLGKHENALECERRSLEIQMANSEGDEVDLALSYDSMGFEYSSLGNHLKALAYYEKALTLWLSVFDEYSPIIANEFNGIGYEYGELGDFRKELEYRTKGLEIAKSIDNANMEAIMHNRLGKTYQKIADKEHAMEHFKLAAAMFKELGNEKEFRVNNDLYNSSFSEIDG